jgi:hypothetical protein
VGEREELLKQAWEGEVVGEAFFAALVEHLPEDRRLWELLTALEATMGALVAPVAQAYGIEVEADTVSASAAEYAAKAPADGRDQTLKMTLAVASRALQGYQALAPLLPAEHAWLGDELISHEAALAAYVEAELEGRPGGEGALLEFLSRHGAEAPARALKA